MISVFKKENGCGEIDLPIERVEIGPLLSPLVLLFCSVMIDSEIRRFQANWPVVNFMYAYTNESNPQFSRTGFYE